MLKREKAAATTKEARMNFKTSPEDYFNHIVKKK